MERSTPLTKIVALAVLLELMGSTWFDAVMVAVFVTTEPTVRSRG